MSSMRNAVQRRQHRERGQLKGREKWGILEKHKDYSLRAKDYNMKKAKLKRLEEKARDRNPDEFAFGMMSSHSQTKGKHGTAMRDSAAARGLDNDAIKLLKTQDAAYLRTVGERIRRQMEKLEEEVRIQDEMKGFLGGNTEDQGRGGGGDDGLDFDDDDDDEFGFDFGKPEKKPKKLVFADDREEQRSLKKSLEELGSDDDDDDEEDEGQDSFAARQREQQKKKSKKQIDAERQALAQARRAKKMRKRAVEVRQNKLKVLKKQHASITAAERALDLQRAKMQHSIGGVNKNGLKFKIRERKR